jgi:hypothetical protein
MVYRAIMGEVVATPGNYGNSYFIKLTWQLPELIPGYGSIFYDDLQYVIQRETPAGSGNWMAINSSYGWNNVYYDVANIKLPPFDNLTIKPDLQYNYKITAYNGAVQESEESMTVTANAPHFPLYGVLNDEGSGDGWEINCGLGIYEYSGRPTITVVGNDFLSGVIPVNHSVIVQIAEEGKAWVTASEIVSGGETAAYSHDRAVDARLPSSAFTGHGWIFIVSPPNTILNYGTTYRVRVCYKDTTTMLIEKYSNTVYITTYSPDEHSFPNMWPNAGLQYGFYDESITDNSPFVLPTAKKGAVGTYERYYHYLYPLPGDIADIEDSPITGNTGSIAYFYSGKAMRLQQQYQTDYSGEVLNLASFNFPFDSFGNRHLGVVCRVVEEPAGGTYTSYPTIEDGYVAGSDGDYSFNTYSRIAQKRNLTAMKPARFGIRLSYTSGAGSLTFRIRKTFDDSILLEKVLLADITTITGHANYYYVDIPYAETVEINEEVRLSVEASGAFQVTTYMHSDAKALEQTSVYSGGSWSDTANDLNYYFSYYGAPVPTEYTSRLWVEGTSGLQYFTSEIISYDEDNRESDELNTIAKGDYATLIAGIFDLSTSNQTRMILRTKSVHDDTHPLFSNVYVGDFMLFDITKIFGSNGVDIYDNTNLITSQKIKAIVKASTDGWWDFNYESNIEPIPFTLSASTDGLFINLTDVVNPYDDMGGMDTTGCLPMAGYSAQYRKLGTSYYKNKEMAVQRICDSERIVLSDVTLGNADPTSSEALEPSSSYQIRYTYSNSSGNSGYSDSTYAITDAYPTKVTGVTVQRYYNTSVNLSYLHIHWNPSTASVEYPITHYWVELQKEDGSWTPYDQVLATSTSISVSPNTVYFCRVRAQNALGYGSYSDEISEVSVSLPSAPQNPGFYFTEMDGETTSLIFTWEPPADDGCTLTGATGTGIVGYVLIHGKDLASLGSEILSYSELMGPSPHTAYTLSIGESAYFKVAAISEYTSLSIGIDVPGIFTDLRKVTFMTYTETVKMRGVASSEGYIDFYFTARTGDGSYIQLTGSENTAAFWRLTDHTAPISSGANYNTIRALIDEESSSPGTNIFKNGIVNPITDGYEPGWPLSTDGDGPVYLIETELATDLFGESVKIIFTMQQYDEYDWDVNASTVATDDSETSIGLNGLGVFLVITDYTTDVSFYRTNTTSVSALNGDFMVTGSTTGSLIWTVNSSVVYNPYLNKNENTPLTSKEFFVLVEDGDSLDDIAIKIGAPGSPYNLQNQLNDYFLGDDIDPAIKELYEDADSSTPFIVATEVIYESDTKYHLKVNIKTTVEGIQNQVTCRTAGLYAFYLATRANTYYVNDMMYELRSFEDMYGRQKPGSTPVYGYTKRSYGFKFNLDYIKEFTEDENASIDLTPIPGTSSANAIGLDVMGTTRTISISGIRVDNSNYWMFHAPFEYIDDAATGGTGQVMQGGVIYLGTSNWGWCKFMKATMGTFQFIDGPYRLVIMTIPSSLMQQYVPDRHCKYQYPDGTYIIQAGTEDMCYVMIERFTTRKNDEMFNAIEYDLVLRRVVALGSSV